MECPKVELDLALSLFGQVVMAVITLIIVTVMGTLSVYTLSVYLSQNRVDLNHDI